MSYKIDSEWMTQETMTIEQHESDGGDPRSTVGIGDRHHVRWQTANLRDTRSGRVYADGAHRVTVDGKAVRGGLFKGETAWSDAERLYGDLRYLIARGRFDGSAKPRNASTGLTGAL